MDDAELVGGVLIGAHNLPEATEALAELLSASSPNARVAIQRGFDPCLIDVLRMRFGRDLQRIKLACALGAAWVNGRRSVVNRDQWELVASLPPGSEMPPGLRHATGETLMRLVSQSTRTLRISAPFMDWSAISFLADAMAAATARGVIVRFLLPTRSTQAGSALDRLKATITRDGEIANLSIVELRSDAPWPHLKVLSSDSVAAYIGSANVTAAGIAGPNLELGVLVQGPPVVIVERILDRFCE